ncbi:phage holin family protein [Andreprevotia sp. IGB-42]|uniref:phage holin family protein n=1 Tax=Andreprevotia sp. IGB-42 TaxID=2497473 RepID=UPI00135BAFD5|nr:phage holin family protein [Andreprevotia sp. IGB-42]
MSPVQRLAANVVGLLHNHLSIFSMELEEERDKLVFGIALVIAAAGLVILGLALVSVAAVWLADPAWRGWTLLGVGLFDLALAGLCVGVVKNRFGAGASPFPVTRAQLRKDREQFLP